jgi:hypothetical protein
MQPQTERRTMTRRSAIAISCVTSNPASFLTYKKRGENERLRDREMSGECGRGAW